MAKAITTSRYSKTADRRKPASASPFRAKDESTRVKAARQMVEKRTKELVVLEVRLASAKDLRTRRALQQRVTATKNNLESWMDYLLGTGDRDEECYREPRAVIIP